MKKGHGFGKIYLFPLILAVIFIVGTIFTSRWSFAVNAEDTEVDAYENVDESYSVNDIKKIPFIGAIITPQAVPDPPAGLTITRADGSFLNGSEYTVGQASYNTTKKFVTITTDDELIVSGTSEAGFIINAGTNAHLIFKNLTLTCTNGIAFDTKQGGKLSVVLADGTINSVRSTGNFYSAFHCGPGSTLTIDDAVRNETVDGKEVIPTGGAIGEDCTIKYYDGTVNTTLALKKGENANKLDSKNAGKLTVRSQGSAAVIGGTYYEDGGTMNFNGGILDVSPISSTTTDVNGSAAAIGGGCRAAGTDPADKITINGGKMKVQSTYHGAAIGGGHNTTGYKSALPNFALKQSTHPSAMGNITINAGYVYAKNGGHGNTIGKGCYGEKAVMHAEDYTLLITGGTVEATATTGGGFSGETLALGATDYGGNASKQSNIIISGGSLRLNNNRSGKPSFDGHAYSDANKTAEVFMTRIDLQGYAQIKSDGTLGTGTSPANTVDLMNMSVAGLPYEYGQPGYVDSTKGLYFWLPNNLQNSGGNNEIRVTLDVKDDQNKPIDMNDFFISIVSNGAYLKQWASFKADPNNISEADRLKKRYDGVPFSDSVQETFLKKLFGEGGVKVENPAGKALTTTSYPTVSMAARKLDDTTLKPLENVQEVSTKTQSGVGKYELIISSTQYANDNGFKNSFWGHRGTYDYAEITPAEADLATTIERTGDEYSDKTIKFASTIRPADGEAATCASPLGKLEYYAVIDDGSDKGQEVKVAEADLSPVMNAADATKQAEKDFGNGKKFHYSEAKATWTPATGVAYARNADNEYKIITKYVPGSDPTDKSNAVNYNTTEFINPSVTITPVAQDFVVDEKSKQGEGVQDKTERIIDKNKSDVTRRFTFGDHGEDGSNSTITLTPSDDNGQLPSTDAPYTYSSSDETVASIDENGNVTFHTDGTVTFTITKPGNAAYESAVKKITYTVNPKTTEYSKLSVNKTAQKSGTGVIKQGDMLVYQIGVTNPIPGTSIEPVVIRDRLPEGLTLVGSALTIRHLDGTVENKARSEVYDEENRIIKVDLGKLDYGEGCVITINTLIDSVEYEDETGLHTRDFGNSVEYGSGDPKKKDSEAYPEKYGPVYPGSGAGQTDTEDPILLEKGCEEAEEEGTLLYTMRVQNRDIVPWYNVSFKDVLPEAITLADNSLTIMAPGAQNEEPLDQSKYYDEATRTIAYPIGTLNPGDIYVIRFKCNVNEEKIETGKTKDDIENIGTLKTNYGELNTPPVHPGETKGNAGSPVGMTLSKQSEYKETAPDEITYTLSLTNNSGVDAGSVVIRDILPEPLKMKGSGVVVVKPDGTLENLKTSAIYDEKTRTVRYSIPGVCRAGDTWTLRFTALITGDGSLKSKAEVEAKLSGLGIAGVSRIEDIKNTGSASGTWPGIPGGGPSWNIHTDPVGPGEGRATARTTGGESGNGGLITDKPDIYITKTAENWSHGYSELHIGDTIGYTIEAGNEAVGDNPAAVSENTILTEYLPAGLEVDYEGMQLIVPNATGGQRSVSPLTKVDTLENRIGTYTVAEGTINRDGKDIKVTIMKVNAGRLKQGERAFLYLTGKATDKVTDIGNSVGLGEEAPLAPVYPGDPDKKTLDPAEETPVVEKNAKPQRKAIEYAVHIKNQTRRSTWRNVQLFDYLPAQLEIVPGSIKIERYEGSVKVEEFEPAGDVYSEETHIITYNIDRLRPGEEYTMHYEAVARGTDLTRPIENRAGYTGEDPSGKKTRGLALNAVPATGDGTNIALWLTLAAVAVAGVTVSVYARKRGRSRR